MTEEKNENGKGEVFSKKIRAGKRTYFFDVKPTKSNDFYLTITESKKRQKNNGFVFEKHKLFLYKEDFDKFINALEQTIQYMKTELMPDVDFSQFQQQASDNDQEGEENTSSDLKWE